MSGRYFLLLFLFITTLYSRENPFFPTVSENIPLTTNQIETELPLKRASVQLPSTARTIEKVTISYKNVDGSIVEKTIELQNSIDWHLPVFITQSYQQEKHPSVKKKASKKSFKEIASLPFIKFKIAKNEILLVTKDKLLRKFLLVKPHRIVCDFKRETSLRSYVKKISSEDVTMVKVGTHKGYYRVVLELDGSYKYIMTKEKQGYLFRLN